MYHTNVRNKREQEASGDTEHRTRGAQATSGDGEHRPTLCFLCNASVSLNCSKQESTNTEHAIFPTGIQTKDQESRIIRLNKISIKE